MLDIISVGDSTIDVFLTLHDAAVKCSLKERECELCLTYADKIPVEDMQRIDGAGNASNNAVGSARLGMKDAIFSVIGNDDSQEIVIKHWKKEGVETDFVMVDTKHGTNYSTVINFQGERTILVFHEHRDYQFPATLPPAKWIYYTSLGKGAESMHADLLAYTERTGAKLVFQPGTYQLKMSKEELMPLLKKSEILIVNREEAARVLDVAETNIPELLTKLRETGVKIAIITDGPAGSYADDGTQRLKLGIFDVPPVERTGCGDAFSTALVAALHHGETLAEAMRWGTANSASVLSYVGPQKGLLDLNAIKEFLKRFPEQPVQI